MPMRIKWPGNSSIATIANLFRLLRTNHIARHEITPGDIILLASVGAGINTNPVCCGIYKIFIINGTKQNISIFKKGLVTQAIQTLNCYTK